MVLSLGHQPLANRLLTPDELDQPEPLHPLELAFCSSCGLAQITEVVPPSELFVEYAYFSSYSDTMLASAEALVRRLVEERGLGPASLAMEIASNDGYLLQHYVAAGVPVLGIDPARNVTAAAEARGVPTMAAFFGSALAEELRAGGIRPDVVHANNVVAHVPDLGGFLGGVARVLSGRGLAVIETPYLRELVDRLEFDTIYHEHLYYYSLTALARLLQPHGLDVVDVEHIPLHGGSLRVFVAHAGADPPAPAVARLLAEEHEAGLADVEYFTGFAARVAERCDGLCGLLTDLRRRGHRIAAYGAAAKGTVLLNALGVGTETLEFVADRNPHKQGRYVPGVHVPIVAPDRLLEDRPDYVLLLAWNLADEVMAQQACYREQGGRFILPHGPRIV